MKPSAIPKSFLRLSVASALVKWVARIEKIGVVATTMEARPLGIIVWPHTIRPAGMRLFSRPMPTRDAQRRESVGIAIECARTYANTRRAATANRTKTIVKGGRTATAILEKKNEPPQSTDRSSNNAHSVWDIALVSFIQASARGRTTVGTRVSLAGNGPHPLGLHTVVLCVGDEPG